MNRTLKDTLTKLCIESGLKWPDALPLALTRIRRAPRKGLKLHPSNWSLGFLPEYSSGIPRGHKLEVGNDSLWKQYLCAAICFVTVTSIRSTFPDSSFGTTGAFLPDR
ncbi:hypothetical protein G0U57_017612 [Chelydra serpentina]|uniref:Uncharacterized protein n=1 Tax=Chelydra serpentina TaxID=8475 RepID=A0A8T1SY76_CHESE|nr:hypothetical protein G0U57_017612 [Chelydra serpentina]